MAMKKELEKAMAEHGYKELTEVQEAAIPRIEQGESLFIRARTGAGKTAAYLLPIINKDRKALIITPTRELALQVYEEARRLSAYAKIHCALLIGGTEQKKQMNMLRSDPQIVIGTPGRITDLFEQGLLITDFSLLVLDEADQIIATGQYEDMRHMLDYLKEDIQTVCLSATWQDVYGEYLKGTFETVETDEARLNENISSYHILTDSKYQALLKILNHAGVDKAMVFVNHRSDTQRIQERLKRRGILAEAFSGALDERTRIRMIKDFQSGKIRVLIATDAAARGLDIAGVSHIIHYDLPVDEETYIHRSGRTAHQNNTGITITLVNEDEKETASAILAETKPFELNEEETKKLTKPLKQKKATRGTQTIVIKAGRNDKLRPKDIIGALCTILPFEEIGVLEVQDRYAEVTILNNEPGLVKKLDGLTIKGKKRRIERKKD